MAIFRAQTPPFTLMISTKVELSFNRIARMVDSADLAELLFPGNRNQQHAFLAVWISLKRADHCMVPNLGEAVCGHGISRRTLERVRAKMRRIGLIDHVSRFNARHGCREGWILSSRFENSLRQLADKIADLKQSGGSKDKELLLLELAGARREAAQNHDHSNGDDEVMKDENDQ
jgi:hypothetical protein